MMKSNLEELRQEYISNYYANKIQQIEDKEGALQTAKWVMEQLVAETKALDLYPEE